MELPPEIFYETIINLKDPNVKEVEKACHLNKGVSKLCKKLRIYNVLLKKNFPSDYERLKGKYLNNYKSDKLKYQTIWLKYHNLNKLLENERTKAFFVNPKNYGLGIDHLILWM